MRITVITTTVILNLWLVIASTGDRSPFYQACLKSCVGSNCTKDDGLSFKPELAQKQELMSQLLLWRCRDECGYECMWATVDGFLQRGFKEPKFHGKWPFIRYFGIQEPAAAISSILNLLAHWHMYKKLRMRSFPRHQGLLWFWHAFAFVCMHAWTWSAIFHTRDFFFTEFMDYSCALSMVMALFVAAVVRVLYPHKVPTALILIPTFAYYVVHVQYLYGGRIDYEYNMAVNIVTGIIGSTIWILWAMYHFLRGVRYVTSLIAFTVISGVLLCLELVDFPPFGGVWDAHALWHLSTVPLPLLFYRFVIDDLEHLSSHFKEN